MCGLAGLILGKKRRRAEERDLLTWQFTRLLVMSEGLGPHATGVAWLNRDGEHALFKRPMRASQLVVDKAFHEVLGAVDNRTTLIMGHARWRTRGDERNNRNNHPIVASGVLGTAQGTIYNADALFRRYRLKRQAQVDSELLVRLAGRAAKNGAIDVARLVRDLRPCRGQMSAALAARKDPERVFLLKGNKPLEIRWNRKRRALLYASKRAYLDAILGDDPGWRVLDLAPMSLAVFGCQDLEHLTVAPLEFIAQARSTQTGRASDHNTRTTDRQHEQNPRGSTHNEGRSPRSISESTV